MFHACTLARAGAHQHAHQLKPPTSAMQQAWNMRFTSALEPNTPLTLCSAVEGLMQKVS